MQKGTFDRKAMEFFSFKFTDHKTLLVCVDQEDQHIFTFNRTFCVYRVNVSTICHISGRKYLIAKMKHKFCESSVTDGRLPFYCGWIRVWLLKTPLHEWGVYVFRSVCGIFTPQPNPAAIMTIKGLCLLWIWNFMIVRSSADAQISGYQCWSDSIEKLMMHQSCSLVLLQWNSSSANEN